MLKKQNKTKHEFNPVNEWFQIAGINKITLGRPIQIVNFTFAKYKHPKKHKRF